MQYETERLILRLWQKSDVDDLYKLAKNEKVGPMCGWNPHQNKEESEFVLQNILMNETTWAIVLKENNHVIGDISLMNVDTEPEMGFWLGYDYWGKGLMREAALRIIQAFFEEMKGEVLWCKHNTSNHQSARVQEKCGFAYHHIEDKHYLAQLDQYVEMRVNVMTYEEYKKKSQ